MARNTATWKMTRTELARTFAQHFGYTGRAGGWIYAPDGRPVAHGWDEFADRLAARGWIKVGAGINWRSAGEKPALRRVTRRVGA